jgi:LmbE family N-acetylglucosaminyl deacetylase
MDNNGPTVVRTAVSQEDSPEEEEVNVTNEQKPLSVPIPEEVLLAVSQNTAELQDKLNKFVNGLNSKIQSV